MCLHYYDINNFIVNMWIKLHKGKFVFSSESRMLLMFKTDIECGIDWWLLLIVKYLVFQTPLRYSVNL